MKKTFKIPIIDPICGRRAQLDLVQISVISLEIGILQSLRCEQTKTYIQILKTEFFSWEEEDEKI